MFLQGLFRDVVGVLSSAFKTYQVEKKDTNKNIKDEK